MNREIWSYCAGVIDSDGCIRVSKQKCSDGRKHQYIGYFEIISVGQVETEAVTLLKKTFGGSIYLRKSKEKKRKNVYIWRIQSGLANKCFGKIHQFLRIKKKQATNCLEFRKALNEVKNVNRAIKGKVGTRKRNSKETARLEAFYKTSRNLNRVGVK